MIRALYAILLLFLLHGLAMQAAVAGETLLEAAQEVESPAAEETAPPDFEPWRPQLAEAREYVNWLKLFSQATAFGGAKIKVPKEVQRVPLEMFEDTKALHDRGIRVYLKELEFRDIHFDTNEEPVWREDHPALASLMQFARIGFNADVKTGIGTFPVGGEFNNGRMPLDLDLTEAGYALNVIPESRRDEAQLDRMRIKFGGPIASAALTGLLGKKAAEAILTAGVGQTLQMDQGDLLGKGTLKSLFKQGEDEDSLENQAIGTVLDLLFK